MIGNLLLVVFVFLLAVFFGWLASRAWLLKKPFLKWPAIFLAGLFSLLTLLIAVLAGMGLAQYYSPAGGPVPEIKVQGTPEQIARGRHLASAFCIDCHSTNADFPMTGGRDLAKDLAMPLGQFMSANLTPAGPLKDWTDGEIFRVLREGVDKDGQKLIVMPTTNARYMSDEDIKAVIAFLRSQEPVQSEGHSPLDRPNLLAFVLAAAKMVPEKPAVAGPIMAPKIAPTSEYGQFMVSFLDCKDCHGEDLAGGTSKLLPNGPSLRVVKGWTKEQFITTLRTGIDPGGNELKPPMPWKASGRLDDVELSALYEYLLSLN
jgi:mono/diheme cytochrome c family protein